MKRAHERGGIGGWREGDEGKRTKSKSESTKSNVHVIENVTRSIPVRKGPVLFVYFHLLTL